MSARLRPMREDEFASFAERSQAVYTADLIVNGRMAEAIARRKAASDFGGLFPQGFDSDVELRVVEDDAGSEVGHVVWGEREQHGGRYAFLYDIEIRETERGRGFGRAAMELLEQEVRGRGYDRLQLNVFGGNERARTLYRSLGFEELSVQMGKTLR
jgi:ribosomal protein S18 acetylase RimI-like enzyme